MHTILSLGRLKSTFIEQNISMKWWKLYHWSLCESVCIWRLYHRCVCVKIVYSAVCVCVFEDYIQWFTWGWVCTLICVCVCMRVVLLPTLSAWVIFRRQTIQASFSHTLVLSLYSRVTWLRYCLRFDYAPFFIVWSMPHFYRFDYATFFIVLSMHYLTFRLHFFNVLTMHFLTFWLRAF